MTVPITELPTGAQEAFDLWKAFTEKWQEVLTAGEDITVTFPNNVEIKSLQKIIKELEILLTQNATALVSKLSPFATDELATAGNIAIRQMYWNTTSSKIRIRTGNETYEDVDKKNTILQAIDFKNPATDKVVSEKALSDLQINFQRLQPFITDLKFNSGEFNDADLNQFKELGLYYFNPAAGKTITNLPSDVSNTTTCTMLVIGTNHIVSNNFAYKVIQYLQTIETIPKTYQRTLSFTPVAPYSDPPAFSDLPTNPTVVGAWVRTDRRGSNVQGWTTIFSDSSGINSVGNHNLLESLDNYTEILIKYFTVHTAGRGYQYRIFPISEIEYNNSDIIDNTKTLYFGGSVDFNIFYFKSVNIFRLAYFTDSDTKFYKILAR